MSIKHLKYLYISISIYYTILNYKKLKTSINLYFFLVFTPIVKNSTHSRIDPKRKKLYNLLLKTTPNIED